MGGAFEPMPESTAPHPPRRPPWLIVGLILGALAIPVALTVMALSDDTLIELGDWSELRAAVASADGPIWIEAHDIYLDVIDGEPVAFDGHHPSTERAYLTGAAGTAVAWCSAGVYTSENAGVMWDRSGNAAAGPNVVGLRRHHLTFVRDRLELDPSTIDGPTGRIELGRNGTEFVDCPPQGAPGDAVVLTDES